jgi:hypothetical protein
MMTTSFLECDLDSKKSQTHKQTHTQKRKGTKTASLELTSVDIFLTKLLDCTNQRHRCLGVPEATADPHRVDALHRSDAG